MRYIGTPKEPAMELEADTKHARAIVERLGLQDARVRPTPAIKMTAEECTKFTSVVMRAAYMAQDRTDVAEAVKTLSRRLRLKRLGRHVLGRPWASLVFSPPELPRELLIEADSDFAGDFATRRKTTVVACMFGSHVIKTQSLLRCSSWHRNRTRNLELAVLLESPCQCHSGK